MITLFVRLKLRLLRNVLRTSAGPGLVVFILASWTLGFAAAVWVRTLSETDRLIAAPLLLGAMIANWMVSPLLFGTNDETIDTTRLTLFDLNPRGVAAGMAASSVVGPGSVAVLIPLLGFASTAPTLISGLLAAVAAVAGVLTATTASRLALTALGASLRRRRSRDLATAAAGLSVGLIGVAAQTASFLDVDFELAKLDGVANIVGLTPIGWAGNALGRASTGAVLAPLVLVAATIGLIAAMLWVWVGVLDRALTEVEDSFVESPIGGHLLRETAVGEHRLGWAVLAKERRYLARHPRYRVQVISQMIVLIIGGAPFIEAILDRNPSSVLFGSIPGLTAGITGSNLLGPDGRGLWGEALALRSLRPLLRGRSLAFVGIGVTISIFVILSTAAYTGGWRYAPIAIAGGLAMALIGAGVGSVTSTFAFASYPDEHAPNPFAASSPGNGCINGAITFFGVIIGLILSVPVLYGLAKADESTKAALAVLIVSPILGLGVWLITTHLAGLRADRRTPEIVAALAN